MEDSVCVCEIAATLCFALSAVLFFWGHNRGFCFHKLHGGRGCMGDALWCEKCGLVKYPENVGFIAVYRALGRVLDER